MSCSFVAGSMSRVVCVSTSLQWLLRVRTVGAPKNLIQKIDATVKVL